MQSWLEGRIWVGKGAQATGMTASLRIQSSKADSNTCESFTRSGLKLESVHQESPRSDVFRKRLPSHFWTRDNVRSVLPGLWRKRTQCSKVLFSILQSLHWLPIKFRISYKILLLTYKALNGLAPAYLTSLLSRYNPSRSLRSQNSGLLVVPRIAKSTKGGRAFSYLAPKLWNSLPDNVQGSDTLSLFKSRLKTHLFSQAFT